MNGARASNWPFLKHLLVADMSLQNIEIMAETPALHADAIEALYDETFGPGHFAKTAERLREFNRSLPELNRVAMSGNLLVAATRMWPVNVETGGAALFVGPVAVKADYRGSKLGLRVTAEAMQAARLAQWRGAILIGAPDYFGQIGFRQIQAETLVFPGPQDQARVMIADLADDACIYSGKIQVG